MHIIANSIIMDNIFDIDDTIYCIFCAIGDMKSIESLLTLNRRCYKIYRQLTQKDISNKVVRKYWSGTIDATRLIYNHLMTASHLHYINSRNMLNLYLAKLSDNETFQKQLLTTLARFIFDKECRCLVLTGYYSAGKSFLRELIVPLMGLHRCDVDHIECIPDLLLYSKRDYIIYAGEYSKDLSYLTNLSSNHKYIVETDMTISNLNGINIAHIKITNGHVWSMVLG